ncbi:hypothetical protein RND81_04G105800 [Saponaria officinalis]|uniref:Gnk2-homologous domain-containing protein n=1 Tax=Saponaria officinalis TaxID=3572 RepID=A0AAW1LDT3_SAPOF
MASLQYTLLLLLLSFTYSLGFDPTAQYCNPNTVTTSSTISSNIDRLLANLVAPFEHGTNFVEASYGKDKTTKVYGLAQCRGDVGTSDCLGCIQDAAQQIRKLCPNQTDARIWYDYCLLRYSQDQFYDQVDTSYGELYKNVENVTNPDDFNQELGNLFKKITSKAIKPSNLGLGKDDKKLSSFETLYGLVQCTRDLSPINCAQCLAIAIENFQGFCYEKKGCRVFYSSCFVRYELYPFYFPLDSMKTKDDILVKSIINR